VITLGIGLAFCRTPMPEVIAPSAIADSARGRTHSILAAKQAFVDGPLVLLIETVDEIIATFMLPITVHEHRYSEGLANGGCWVVYV
jgi:hypothetical protein